MNVEGFNMMERAGGGIAALPPALPQRTLLEAEHAMAAQHPKQRIAAPLDSNFSISLGARVCIHCESIIRDGGVPGQLYCSETCKDAATIGVRSRKIRRVKAKVRSRPMSKPRSRVPNIPGVSSGMLGAFNELMVSADLLLRGVHVFRAVSPSCPCDIIALHDAKIIRIEVTTGYLTVDGDVSFNRHDTSNYDVVAAVVARETIVYLPDIFPPRPTCVSRRAAMRGSIS